MKQIKTLVLVILVLGVSFTTYAQKDKKDDKPDKFGIRFGHQSANLFKDSKPYEDFTSLSTFYIGTFKYFKVFPFVKFGSGLEFFQTGTVSTNKNKMHLYYLSVPFNLHVKLGPFFALGGIAPSFKVSEKWEISGDKINPASDDKTNWFDAPVFVGAGFKFLMFSIEARYHWGTMSLYDGGVGEGYKNQYFQLGLGIWL
jgi:hypothetical protein